MIVIIVISWIMVRVGAVQPYPREEGETSGWQIRRLDALRGRAGAEWHSGAAGIV